MSEQVFHTVGAGGPGYSNQREDCATGHSRSGKIDRSRRDSRFFEPSSGHRPRKSESRIGGTVLSVFVFVMGICVSLYPYVAQQINNHTATELVAAFDESVSRGATDGAPSDESTPGIAYGSVDENMFASIYIPKLSLELPVYVGSVDANLSKGIAHLEGSSLPTGGPSTHSVLAGHNGAITNEWFTRIDQLDKGDLFYIRNSERSLTYHVVSSEIIEPDDTSSLLIEPDRDLVTLLTCTDSGKERLVVTGERVEKG